MYNTKIISIITVIEPTLGSIPDSLFLSNAQHLFWRVFTFSVLSIG